MRRSGARRPADLLISSPSPLAPDTPAYPGQYSPHRESPRTPLQAPSRTQQQRQQHQAMIAPPSPSPVRRPPGLEELSLGGAVAAAGRMPPMSSGMESPTKSKGSQPSQMLRSASSSRPPLPSPSSASLSPASSSQGPPPPSRSMLSSSSMASLPSPSTTSHASSSRVHLPFTRLGHSSSSTTLVNSRSGGTPVPSPASVMNIPSSASSFSVGAGKYDPKLVGRELSGPGDLGGGDAWQAICVKVLPLFNGEQMMSPIEDLNELVTSHARATIARIKPARALDSLISNLSSLVATGMLTLRAKLAQHVDEGGERLVSRLVEVWTFFFGQVLPWLEGVFLPFQTDPGLIALAKSTSTSAPPTASDPHAYSHASSSASPLPPSASTRPRAGSSATGRVIDVRRLVLLGFRDALIIPLADTLEGIFSELADPSIAPSPNPSLPRAPIPSSLPSAAAASRYAPPPGAAISPAARLQQMTLVLASIRSADPAQASIDRLARAFRRAVARSGISRSGSASSSGFFASSAVGDRPGGRRDRRGWIRRKGKAVVGAEGAADGSTDEYARGWNDPTTPTARNGLALGLEAELAALGDELERGYTPWPPHAQRKNVRRPPSRIRTRPRTQFDPDKDSEDEWLDTLRSPNPSSGPPSVSASPVPPTPPHIHPRGSSLAHAEAEPDVGGAPTPPEAIGETSDSDDDSDADSVPVFGRWEEAQKELERMVGIGGDSRASVDGPSRRLSAGG